MTRTSLLSEFDPPAFELHNARGSSTAVLICDHASHLVPSQLGTLGLPPGQLTEHIGWDPGAAEVALQLSSMLDAPLVMSGYSRLVIDCNRPPQRVDSIAPESAGVCVPGNLELSDEDRAERIESLFQPYHRAIDELLDARADRSTVVLSIHSFTPCLNGQARPWHIGISARNKTRLAQSMVAELSRNSGINIGENAPYAIEDEFDYSLPVHAEARGLAGVMIEIRQDGLRNPVDIAKWARRLAAIYQQIESEALHFTV